MSIDHNNEPDIPIGENLSSGQSVVDVDDLIVGRDSDVVPVVSVVLPTLDEERGIQVCLDQVKEAVEEIALPTEIIVSDSSSDRTPQIARANDAIVVEPEQAGYGNAYKCAFRHVRGEYVAIGDADTTYDFRELPRLFETAVETDADIVIGSRFDGEIKPGAMPALHQYVGNPLLTRFLNVFYNADVGDAHSGMRVIKTDALAELDLQSGGMEFASEMIMAAATLDMTIEEVPITYHERVGEATLDSFSDGWRHVRFMLTNAPGYLFTLPSLVFGIVGFGIIAGSVAGVTLGSLNFGIQTLIVGVLLIVVSHQVGCLVLFSSTTNPIREPGDPITQLIRSRFTLEGGAASGVILSGLGVGFLVYGTLAWLVAGYTAVPRPTWNLIAAGTAIIGVQTIFNSFCFGMLREQTE